MAFSHEEAESLVVASQLRRSRRTWRIVAFVALGLVVLALLARFGTGQAASEQDHIARVRIEGVITTDAQRLAILQKLADNDKVRGVIIAINSPGGAAAGGEELYEAISAIRAKKPVVAVIQELGASAAYMTAIASDRIYARRLSIVGSIGVLIQHVNAAGLLDKIGLEFDKVATGPLKAEPDINDPLAGPARQSLQALVDDSFAWFVDIVAERRGMDRGTALGLADGRVVTGRVALQNNLIDGIGSESEAINWLETEKGLAPDLKVLTYFPVPKEGADWLFDLVGAKARSAVGLDGTSSLALDGLISLWQVEATL